MAGHNKWAQIKRKKAVTDAVKSSIFGKLAKRIALEAKKVHGDMNASTLRAAIEAGRKENCQASC